MGRLIVDNTCEPKPMSKEEIVENLKTMVFGVQAFNRFNAKERETLDKAWNIIDQYENRLKADMIAMLEELDNKIMEVYIDHMEVDWHEIIQQKINSLKEDTGAK